jgi:arylformamidase
MVDLVGRWRMKIVDLTYELPFEFLSIDQATSNALPHSTNPGTYIDSPSLVLAGGKTIDLFEPESFVRDAVLLDLTHKKSRQLIDDEDLEAAEERAGLTVREGEAVIVQTGWEKFVHAPDYMSNHPGLSENGVEYLEFKRVAAVGVDTPSVDHPDNHDFRAHRALLSREILVIENLCNLEKIDQSRFPVIALPLKMKASRSPIRAIAILTEST